MGVHRHPGTMPGGLTPICSSCGVSLCWDIGQHEYLVARSFWDAWVCRGCNGGAAMKRPTPEPMVLLVCGGRNYNDERAAFLALDRAHAKRPIRLVIHGDADGADTLAKMWAQMRGIPDQPFPADWLNITRPGAVVRKRRDGVEYDALAGHVRNQRMIDEGRPDGVLALPGGTGTADMVRRAEAAGLPVWRPYG